VRLEPAAPLAVTLGECGNLAKVRDRSRERRKKK
jgi:hypothetical protein